jgi:hypothetical protein
MLGYGALDIKSIIFLVANSAKPPKESTHFLAVYRQLCTVPGSLDIKGGRRCNLMLNKRCNLLSPCLYNESGTVLWIVLTRYTFATQKNIYCI